MLDRYERGAREREQKQLIFPQPHPGVAFLRLVFTNDGVVVKVVERYDPVKTKPTESEAEQFMTSSVYDQVKIALSESQAEAEE